jgi:23S rRNA (adenine2503-C2)-methyltransferase
MEVYRTLDGKVTKFVHDDGSESAIKYNYTCDTDGGSHGPVLNKYNIFISSDVGCPVGCKFCYLTAKKFEYHKLSGGQILKNIIEAIETQVVYDPTLRYKYLKISWMGMSDPFLDRLKTVAVTNSLIEYVIYNKLCCGIDGIDIATTLPLNNVLSIQLDETLTDLYTSIEDAGATLNPQRNYRNPIRIFYSLHAGTQKVRSSIIPTNLSLNSALFKLGSLPRSSCSLIFHYVILDGINDSDREIENIIMLTNLYDAELRILRYNKCPNSIYNESKRFNEIVDTLKKRVYLFKVQSSIGGEIFAACGQFLLNELI